MFAPNSAAMAEAKELIEESMVAERDLEFGAIYNAKIVDSRPNGLVVSLYEGMNPPVFIHNSQLDVKKVVTAGCLSYGHIYGTVFGIEGDPYPRGSSDAL